MHPFFARLKTTSAYVSIAALLASGLVFVAPNAALAESASASVTGVVTLPDGVDASLADVTVELYSAVDDSAPIESSVPGESGTYLFAEVEPGDYKVRIASAADAVIGEWWNDAATFAAAATLTLSAGQQGTGVDAALAAAAVPVPEETAPEAETAPETETAPEVETAPAVEVTPEKPEAAPGEPEPTTPAVEESPAQPESKPSLGAKSVALSSIAGKVTLPASYSFASSYVDVSAYSSTNSTDIVAQTSVATDGTFLLSGLPAGSYRLSFVSSGGEFATTWYSGKGSHATANSVTVAGGEDKTGINVTLSAVQASISGTAKLPTGVNTANGDVLVTAYAASTGAWVANTTAAAGGAYSLRGLAAGSYKLEFSTWNPGAISEWYNDKPDQSSAVSVTVAKGETKTGINATLAKAASVSGKVTLPTGVTSFSGAYYSVVLYRADGSYVTEVAVATNGTYSFDRLPAGTYNIEFRSGSTAVFGEWWNDKPTRESSTALTLAAGEKKTGVNATLAKTASIAGTVTLPAGMSFANGSYSVYVYGADGSSGGSASVASNGTYSVGGLKAGTYKVQFAVNGSDAISEWSNDKPTREEATPITLTAGQQRTGVNATLAKGASISGKVTLPKGVVAGWLPGSVTAYGDGFRLAGYAWVAADGSYTIRGLEPGNYRLSFSANVDGVLPEWWNNATSFETATPIVLTAQQGKTGVNATLAKAASISGKVTVPAALKADLAGIDVVAYDAQGRYFGAADVQPDGTYSIGQLVAGSYRLNFTAYASEGRLLSEWLNDKDSLETATALSVVAGQRRTGANVTLAASPVFSGKATYADGTAAAGALVTAYDRFGSARASTRTSPTGTYTLPVNSVGDRTISITAADGTTFVGGARDIVAATFVAITAGKKYTANVVLAGVVVSGKATTDKGAAVAGTATLVSSGGGIGDSVSIAKDGSYRFKGVRPGTYSVRIQPSASPWLPTWLGGSTDASRATYVAVSKARTLATVAVVRSGTVTGTAPTNIDPSLYASLQRLSADGSFSEVAWVTLKRGEAFRADGLAPGTYTLKTDSYYLGGVPATGDVSKAKRFTVAAGATTKLGTISTAPATTGGITGALKGADSSNAYLSAQVFSESGQAYYSRLSGSAFEFSGLPAGKYRLFFSYYQGGDTRSAWYGATTAAKAKQITVTAGAKTKITVTTPPSGVKLSGTLTDAKTRAPLVGAYVQIAEIAKLPGTATEQSFFVARSSATGTDGKYSFAAAIVPGRTYRLTVGTREADYPEQAVTFTAASGAQTRNLSVTVNTAVVTGVVVDAVTGKKLSEADIWAYSADGTRSAWGTTDAAGSYSFQGLRAGGYTLRFGADLSSGYSSGFVGHMSGYSQYAGSYYAPQWLSKSLTQAGATKVTAVSGKTTTVATAKVSQAGIVSGRLSAKLASGTQVWLSDSPVSLYTTSGAFVASTVTNPDGIPGAYSFTVAPGTYRICAAGPAIGITAFAGTCGTTGGTTTVVAKAGANVTKDVALKPALAVGKVAISGKAVVGTTLTASTGTWTSGTTFSYQWRANGAVIAGATGKTLKLAAAHVGKKITVTVTGAKAGYASFTSSSAATAAVTR